MGDYMEELEFNPRRLEQVEERLDLIHNLKRKYGGSIEAVLAFGRDARSRLEQIAHADERIEELEAQQQSLLHELAAQALQLSDIRKKAAASLSSGVERELADLSMLGARFTVDFKQIESPDGLPVAEGLHLNFDDRGFDRVEFLIAPNPGEGFKPLVKIASGGETSRLMLALKNVLAQADYVPTLIFDEIDQGIGGRVGAVVGEKLWQLARQHQVLCVTHLPQLAAYGRQHFRVQKGMDAGRTQTEVQLLDDENRIEEMAQMFGPLSEENRAAARATLQQARLRSRALAQ
jgi:DNA repair protein RecN (Recombination protein N)